MRRLTACLIAAIGVVGGTGSAAAQALDWNNLHHSAPERYTVVSGDTLWDIAGRFLESPWQWPELWRENPQIANPHRIYPGDHLTLHDCNGSPCVKLERGRNVVKLSPQMRTTPAREAIEPIPLNITRAFLNDHRVVNDPESLDELAYVVAGDDRRLISGAGDRLYARGRVSGSGRFGIYRMGEAYLSPEGDFLGQELEGIGEARHVRTEGDIVQLELLETRREVRNNDIVLPLESRTLLSEFQPRPPLNDIEGSIIAAPGGVRFIGRLQVVTLNRGTLHGLQPGHVLRVEQQGERVHDPRTQEVLQLPGEEAGAVLVFRPYDQVSYALVMRASRSLEVGDRVHRPD
ncbi:LysM domain-containing protein [Vreelandella rituensis]|uniref:LysM domain-containing protein n=1 Tax=Vreelandella rituensis TaxID=2282306 RepID=A0A368U5Z7_9GAMM|nr:LysM domain-containing protein [Halomonas rituensis]